MSFGADGKQMKQALMQLPQPEGNVQCEYVWIDGTIKNFRTKSKTWARVPLRAEDLPLMEFCGSATDFDVGDLADYYAKPVRIFKDPFRTGSNRLIFCETYSREGLPTFANNRFRLVNALRKQPHPAVMQFTFDQTYSLLRRGDGKSLSHMDPAYLPDTQSGFSCGWEVAESHYKACLYAGVDLGSLEAVKRTGEWKYSIGPCTWVDLGDAVWMSRFLLRRVGEDFGVDVGFQTAVTLHLRTDDTTNEQRQRILECLLSKFVLKDVKVAMRERIICLSSPDGHRDPYAFLTQVLETLTSGQHLDVY